MDIIFWIVGVVVLSAIYLGVSYFSARAYYGQVYCASETVLKIGAGIVAAASAISFIPIGGERLVRWLMVRNPDSDPIYGMIMAAIFTVVVALAFGTALYYLASGRQSARKDKLEKKVMLAVDSEIMRRIKFERSSTERYFTNARNMEVNWATDSFLRKWKLGRYFTN